MELATTGESGLKNIYRITTLALGLLCLTASIWLTAPVHASDASRERPRIGLVLGGGGARGAAHVGVLKVLEAQRIPIDYVVGTSMGSIVAGLYASGMSVSDIEKEMLSLDWNDLFDDSPTRADRSFRRKRDDDLYAFKARVGYNDSGLQIPLAYIRGQKFDLELNRLTLPVFETSNFDDLPIPFRAVATDLETGKEVVLARGSLPRSIRASMAVPAAFDPVEIDGRLLIDGGIANNVPVSAARELGADVFIVVDVGSGLFSREEIKSALDVSGQLTNYLFSLNTETQLASLGEDDVLIKPPLGDIGGGDFGRIAEAIPTGEEGANEVLASLQRYSLDAEEYAAHRATQRRRVPPPLTIDFVRIDNQSRLADDVIRERITARPGQPLDIEKLKQDIGHVYGLEIFETVRYKLVQENEQTGLVITARGKHWGPGYIQFGMSTSNDFEGDASYSLGVVYTRTEINELNGEWRSAVQLGEEPAATMELHQPLDPLSRYFVAGKIGVISKNINVFNDDADKVARYYTTLAGIELSIGREFGTWGEGRLGYRRGTGEAEVKTGSPSFPDLDADRGELFIRLSDDRLDNLYFPRDGHFGKLEYIAARETFGANQDYQQWVGAYSHAFSWGQNTVIGALALALTEDDDAPLESLFQLGGLFRLSGLQNDQLSGQRLAQVNLIYMRQLSADGFFTLFESFAGMSLETGNVWQTSDAVSADDTINAGSLFLGFDTPIGPLYLAYGRTDIDQQSLYFYLGPRFTF
jgi:NTE family protein